MLSRVPVDLSIVEYSLDAGEDIFLTYTWERSEGPHIQRTGKGPPTMQGMDFQGEPITNPFALRQGTWLIQEDMRKDETAEAKIEFEKTRSFAPARYRQIFQDTIQELDSIKAHDTVFKGNYPDHDIVGMQGCGDLTMNLWNVAYINNNLGHNPPALVCLHEEEPESRTYSCLVKWKGSEARAGRVTIEEVMFRRKLAVRNTNEMVGVRFGNKWLPRGDLIDFAVSNQQVIRNGEIVPVVTTCHQFGDLRHLLLMPNLNPKGPLYSGEPPAEKKNSPHTGDLLTDKDISYHPRLYFGEKQYDDIWLGEEAFLSDTSQNLRRAALTGPIFIPISGREDMPRFRGALNNAGYREISSALQPLSAGDWRFVRRGQKSVLEIYFKRNVYGWTMIGLSADKRRIISLACTGRAGQTGYVLEEAAELLLRAGATNALLIDEGNDVLQKVQWSGADLVDMVPSQRRRLRSMIIFARAP
jgi:hypothetical protein